MRGGPDFNVMAEDDRSKISRAEVVRVDVEMARLRGP
jgi:hypothetical protein